MPSCESGLPCRNARDRAGAIQERDVCLPRCRIRRLKQPGRKPRVIRGKALIFWDPKLPGGQVTPENSTRSTPTRSRPAADCVSESLDDARRTVEGRLVPLPDAGFPRARASRRDVRHRRRSIRDRLVARDEPRRPERRRRRSRPRAGDRLRQQHGGHLPPQRAQSRTARGAESARPWPMRATATSSHSIPSTRRLTNVTQAKEYDPVPLTPKEDEIRRSGGIITIGRREFPSAVTRAVRYRIPRRRARAPDDDDRADHLGASRRQGSA